MLSRIRPLFVENSSLPKILSKIAPIDIRAIILGPLVFVKGLASPVTRRHESIHLQQQIELLFVGFYFLYIAWWVYNYITLRNGRFAYLEIPFEKEAYRNDMKEGYLQSRKRYAWIDHIRN